MQSSVTFQHLLLGLLLVQIKFLQHPKKAQQPPRCCAFFILKQLQIRKKSYLCVLEPKIKNKAKKWASVRFQITKMQLFQ